jgi:competence protein ComEA
MAATLDINAAASDEIDAVEGLEGHGPEIARYREERGGFTDLRQLEEVPGLAGKVTDAVRGRLRIGG